MKARGFWMMGLAAALMASHAEVSGQTSVGTAFTYQGRLTDGGSPANADYDFQFELYDDPAVGGQVGGTVTVEDHTVTDGLFAVPLDFGSDIFASDARWLAIGVRPWDSVGAYTPLLPRQELTPAPYALALPGLWTQQNATSPNVIGGYSGNSMDPLVVGGTISGGGTPLDDETLLPAPNMVIVPYGTVGGGSGNSAGGTHATVGGGKNNNASGNYSTIAGGKDNTASGTGSAISGGIDNLASAYGSAIGGGTDNVANDDYSTIAGGNLNYARGPSSAVLGGVGNEANDWYGTVAGGYYNINDGAYSSILGGSDNTVGNADYSVILVWQR